MPATDYCTLTDLKAQKGLSDSIDDAVLSIAISAASRQIDGYCGWRFWQDDQVTVQTYYPDSPRYLDLMDDTSGDGISTTTGLVVKVDMDNTGSYESTLTLNTDFIVAPTNAQARTPLWPYTALQIVNPVGTTWFPRSLYGTPTVQVTAKFGWPAVPDDIFQACLIQAQMLASAKDAAFGVAALAGIDGVGMRASAWNPLARSLIEPYRKPAIG